MSEADIAINNFNKRMEIEPLSPRESIKLEIQRIEKKRKEYEETGTLNNFEAMYGQTLRKCHAQLEQLISEQK